MTGIMTVTYWSAGNSHDQFGAPALPSAGVRPTAESVSLEEDSEALGCCLRRLAMFLQSKGLSAYSIYRQAERTNEEILQPCKTILNITVLI